MKNLTKKLFLSMLTVAFAVVALGTTTFAWFTLSTEAKVDPFNGQVTGGEGFEIAVSKLGATKPAADAWRSGSITAEQILAANKERTGKAADAFRLDAISPVLDAENKFGATVISFEQLGLNTQGGHKKYEMEPVAETQNNSEKYIAFTLHFRLSDTTITNGSDVNLTSITLGHSDKPFAPSSWTAGVDYQLANGNAVTGGKQLTYLVENAARVAIIPSGAIGGQKIFELDETSPMPEESSDTGNENTIGFQELGALSYFNNFNNLKPGAEDEKSQSIVLPTEQYATVKTVHVTGGDTAYTGPSQAGYINFGAIKQAETLKLNVYVWLEGWDGECMNPIFNQTLTVALGFALKAQKKQG